MHKLQVQLSQPLVSVASRHRVSFVDVPENDNFGQEPPQKDLVLEVATQICSQLSNIQRAISQQNAQVQSAAATYAIEMVRMLMQKDDEVLIARVQHYIEMALQEAGETEVPLVYVNPMLVDSVREHLAVEGSESIQVEAESTLAKEDCRVEFKDNGLIASLEHQMQVVTSRLGEAISGGVSS